MFMFAWVLGFLFAARIVAGMLCMETRTYTDDTGVRVHEMTEPDPEIVWDLIQSPVFVIPAIVVLFSGWFFVWRSFTDRPTADSR